jgi:hypothetical protein
VRALRLGLLALAALAAHETAGQEVSLRAEVDARKVGVLDQFSLTITLEGGSGDVPLPRLENLRVVSGPMVSTRMSIVNGAMSHGQSHVYVLQAMAPGRAEIGAVRLKLGSGEKTTAPIAIEVERGSVLPPRPQRRADPFGDPFGGDQDPFEQLFGARPRGPAPKIFVEQVPSRTRLYVGEPLLLTYNVYTQTSITDLQFVDAPQYPGFWSEDLERAQTSPAGEPVSLEGESYRRFPVLRKLLFPTRAGKLTIPAAQIRLGVARGLFDPGRGGVERATKPVVIDAQAIPDEPGFSGAVGRFRASASLDKTTVPLGEAATLRFKVEGSGNLKWVEQAPELVVPNAKVFPPQVRSELQAGASGISGSKTWEFVIVPETAGALQVPPLTLSYFDPASGRIGRASSEPLPMLVQGAPGVPGAVAAAAPPAGGGGALVLRSELDLPARALPRLAPRVTALALGLVVTLHAGVLAAARLSERRRLRAGRASPRRSVRAALSDLARAGRDGMSKEASAALIEKTIHDVFGSMPEGAAGDERERAAREVLQQAQFLRYAPQLGDYSEKIRDVAARASEVIRKWA